MNVEAIKNYFSSYRQTPLQQVTDDIFLQKKINLFIKRDDLIDEHLSGNKFFKLKYNLIEAAENNYSTLLSFGGAYSNHIYSLAYAGKIFGFKAVGVIRGEEHLPLNPTLSFAKECGMEFYYLSRSEYRKKYSEEILSGLEKTFGDFYLIPEGGSNFLAVRGCSEIPKRIEANYDYIFCACGTGGTIAGIIDGSDEISKVIGVADLKNASFLKEDIYKLSQTKKSNWEILLDYHFGGYAKFSSELLSFIKSFEEKFNIPLEPIYTGKMLFAIYDLTKKNFFPENSTIVAYHSGGLQGLKGLRERKIWS
ncbi:1-Aminocyclopropane-1-carboxylate deaminase [Ignavibacterium album JCM 16511]|uniref:1-Aminocyclopropane-1-carboxylate deaminase n=1 Tax=Ignavibacterium album (strain DSM 19864 / JCM 16511 / NBRC 101810 / Mat9-16) TaxID=945713 RepID=I0ANA2_IGNAJ|nr:pyridoxal-phosphate dependent enzyme [Ignavibacterium album]AFH50459.1 1-Aminocyclopropane-1-carboxylate deaminase [Ignavibacterium album JCM 16511]